MSLAAIQAAIPHRAPFLFVDEVVAQDEQRIHCRKKFTGEEFFYQGHYPHFPLTPGVLLIEAGMQAGAVLLSKQAGAAPGKVPVATRVDGVKFKRMVRPGDTIDIEIDLVERMADTYFMKAKVSCGRDVAARFEFACTMAEPQQK
jgi:3-hydroxyacyl-[acyl-carrier-protein] dehydratase